MFQVPVRVTVSALPCCADSPAVSAIATIIVITRFVMQTLL
jgi:hypothetical protein